MHLTRLRIGGWTRLQIAAVTIMLAMLFVSGMQRMPERDALAAITAFDIEITDPVTGDAAWMPVIFPDGVQKARADYRIRFDLDEKALRAGRPLGLRLSGLFASKARWNGVALGANGVPADRPSGETPGRVDHIFLIPAEAAQPGENTVELEISSHHRWLGVDNVFHRIAIEPYSGDPRRSLREYTSPLIAIGALSFALLGIAALPARRSILTAMIVAAWALAAIEMSRALFNYSYPFHAIRISGLAIAATLFGGFYLRYALDLVEARRGAVILSAYGAISLALIWLTPGWDIKTFAIILSAAAAVAGAALYGLKSGDQKAGVLLVSALPFLIASAAGGGAFLDRYFYVALIPFLLNLYWIERTRQEEANAFAAASANAPATPPRISYRDRAQILTLDPQQICAATARGNHCEILHRNGKTTLISEPLGAFAEKLPANFQRAHRSHMINMDQVTAIRRVGPGKYEAQLGENAKVPVSRSRFAALADVLGGVAAP